MANTMASGTFRLKGRKLLSEIRNRDVNPHQISMRSGVSYPTIDRYFKRPEEVEGVNLRALYGVLVDGMGYTPEQLQNMRIGDLFDLVPDKESGAK